MHSHARMGAIQNLLGKLGYVNLDRYGLLLTPDGRVLSQRPAVLDDGLGGRIVGWEDGDLAAMELEQWEPARPAKKRATARRVAVAMAPTIPAPARPQAPLAARIVAPAAPVVVAPAPAVAPAAAAAPFAAAPAPAPAVVAPPTQPPAVEAADEPEDDDWEWVIAIARARAAADEVETAAAAPKFIAAQTQPMAKVATPAPAAKHVVAAKPVPPPLPPPGEDTKLGVKSYEPPKRAPSPKTIIPVPQLPRVTDPSLVRPAVVARGTGPQASQAPLRRVPRSTNRIEDTVRTAPAPANDDRTSPGIALPPASGGRKVAAKQK